MRIDLSGNILTTSANTISKICKPLHTYFNIDCFCYCKIFKDGSRIILCNNPDVIQFFYDEDRFKNSWFFSGAPASAYHSCKVSWAIEHMNPDLTSGQSILIGELEKYFSLTTGIDYIECANNFVEVYGFGAHMPNIYRIKDSTYRKFFYYFKEQAKKIITGAEQEKIYAPKLERPKLIHEIGLHEEKFLNELNIKQYYLNDNHPDTYLTSREVDCIKWCIKGKTANEIAILLGSSKRTIEHHIANIMLKLNCYKQTQLIRKAVELGITDW